MNEPKKTPNLDIDLSEHVEDILPVILTVSEAEAVRQLLCATTVGDLVRLKFPHELTKPLYTAQRKASALLTEYYKNVEQT